METNELTVLYEDNHLIVVVKPQNVPTQGDSSGDTSLLDMVKEYIEYMALCGLNSLMLYMEDVYEVEGYPYFGYMRGRYSMDEMKEIASRTDSVTFSAEGSWVRLHIFCFYFDDVASEEEKDDMFIDTLASHPALLKALLAEMESAGYDTSEYKERFSEALSE